MGLVIPSRNIFIIIFGDLEGVFGKWVVLRITSVKGSFKGVRSERV